MSNLPPKIETLLVRFSMAPDAPRIPNKDGVLMKRQKQVQVELGFKEDENLDAEETQEIVVGEEETGG